MRPFYELPTGPALNVASLGAGRQSTAMILMATHGLIQPALDAAIFADTGDEPAWVYETLDWLRSGNVALPFPIHVVRRGDLIESLFAGDDQARIPFFVKAGGIATRQCTRNFKIRPIRRGIRKLLGVGPHGYIAPGSVVQWIGLSADEAWRVKPAGVAFMVNRYPLIEAGLKTRDCVQWLGDNGYPVPWPSACVSCPYLAKTDRLRIKTHDPPGHARACRTDRELRSPDNVRRFRGELYVDRSRQPLETVDLEAGDEQGDLFGSECEGMCGL